VSAASSRRPRVMHVVAKLHLGGSEVVAISLAEALRGEVDFSFFAVLGIEDDPVGRDMKARLDRAGIPVYTGTSLDMKRGGMLVGAWQLRRALRRVRPDVVHLHTDIPDATYGASTLFVPGRPPEAVVRTVHNTTLWPKWDRIGAWVERRIEHGRMVGVSDASLEALQVFRERHGLRRLPAEQTGVILNGVSVPPTAPAERTPGPARLLFAGRLEPQKGVDLLPAIIERAEALTDRDAEVTVAGAGALAPMLSDWAARARGRWKVTLAAPIAGLNLRLRDYDALLMPSRHEGLALTCIECVLAGTPVIVSDIDGLREIFPARPPLSSPPEDVERFARLVADVVTDPDRHRQEARTLIAPTRERFGVERMARDYLRWYGSAERAEASEGQVTRERSRRA